MVKGKRNEGDDDGRVCGENLEVRGEVDVEKRQKTKCRSLNIESAVL